MYSSSSDFPQTYCACCGLAFDTFFMSLKVRSLVTHRSGNSSNRDIVNTSVSAFDAFVSAPNPLSCITSFSGAAAPV